MKGKNARGSITVFLSLSSVLFLSLIFSVIESARIQGARAQTANITDMGNYSLFGEYEKKLLEDYEIFSVDGSYGTGDFSIDRVNDRFKMYLSCNASPRQERVAGLCFDPWRLHLEHSEIKEYALLSDQEGENFYQQAVAYMKETLITGNVGKLAGWYRDARQAEEKQKEYEQRKKISDQAMEQLKRQEEEKKAELEQQRKQAQAEAEAGGEIVIIEENPAEQVKRENPLKMLNRLKKKGILEIVCGKKEISEKKVAKKELVSRRHKKKGSMELKKEHGGLTSDLLFREYLLDRFPNYLSEETNWTLEYQTEYLIAGKRSDRENLKAVVQRLLLIREGLNYLYCVGNTQMNSQAGALASLLIGWTGIPALVTVLKHGLLMGWAYGESLMDVRILLEGGKIPLNKTPDTWMVSLEQLGRLDQLLEQGSSDKQEGLSYRDYLRILFYLQPVSGQKKRGLDLVDLNLKLAPGLSNFQIDHCVVGIREETNWQIEPVFSRVPAVFLGTPSDLLQVTVESGFAYD